MRRILVVVSTASIAIGLVGAAAPAQAHSISAAAHGTDKAGTGGTAAHAAKIERELDLVPAGIGDSTCKNGTLQYGISLDALPNVARSMDFRVTVPGRGKIAFDGLDVDQDGGKAWYSACVSKGGYRVIAKSKRLTVTGNDIETGRKVTPRSVKVYVTDC